MDPVLSLSWVSTSHSEVKAVCGWDSLVLVITATWATTAYQQGCLFLLTGRSKKRELDWTALPEAILLFTMMDGFQLK